ncbi:MAG: transcriptional regulator [Lentisphaerae bacterium GWF2_44_16]|nr:MAG: transcriptional regulator [Lentisphaerae bacterium GWF2_44_16]
MRELSRIFKALSDKNRIRIIKMLQCKPMCVCELAEVLGLAMSTVSKHLTILRDVELINDLKDGKWVDYSLSRSSRTVYARELLRSMSKWLNEDDAVKADIRKAGKVSRKGICG